MSGARVSGCSAAVILELREQKDRVRGLFRAGARLLAKHTVLLFRSFRFRIKIKRAAKNMKKAVYFAY
jgi:hypothetical protein